MSKQARIYQSLRFIVGAYLFFWTPYQILYDIAIFSPQKLFSSPEYPFTVCIHLLEYLNSAINPFMYAMGKNQIASAIMGTITLGRWQAN